MAGAVMSKIWNLIGVDTNAEEKEEYDEDYTPDFGTESNEEDCAEEEETRKIFGIGRKSKVVSMPQTQVKMKICRPTTFEQSQEIANLLKEKNSVIVNLEYVNKDVARRVVDFISGATYAIDGHMEKISNSIFVVAPGNYEIANDTAKDEIKSKLSVSWLRN